MHRLLVHWIGGVIAACAVLAPPVARGQTPRDLLTHASFVDRDRGVALKRIEAARAAAAATLRQAPGDVEAALMQAMAIGYRAKLNGSRTEAIAARTQFEAIVAAHPRHADAQLALGAWHVGAIFKLGRMMARAALGAQKGVALAALDRAVTAGGGRAFVPGLVALLRLELDPADPRAKALAEAASTAPASTPLDRIMQRAAAAILVSIRAGDDKATRALAARLLPFGQMPGAS